MRNICLTLAAFFLSGCGAIYTNIHVPWAYRSPTPSDVRAKRTDAIATGEACNYVALLFFSWGNGGYAAAVRDALKDKPDAILYDVKTDIQVRLGLVGIYARTCTQVTGKVGYP